MAVIEPRVEQEQILYEWEGLSRPHKPLKVKSVQTPMVIVVLVGIVLVISMEWMLILLLSALVFAYYAWMMVPPDKVVYKITSRGIRVGGMLYEWGSMGSWWIDQQWGSQVIVVESAQAMLGRLNLPIDTVHLEKASEAMGMMLVREEPTQKAIDKAGKWLEKRFPLVDEK